MKLAIQGIKGLFHHIAVEQYFGKNRDLIECLSFTEMPNLLHTKKVEIIIMALENFIVGAILRNYALVDEHQLTIYGEHHLPIHHHLIGLKGQNILDVTEVYAHPKALLQCHKIFRAVI